MAERAPPHKVIAGTPDTPLVIGDVEIPCYVLEDETRVLSQRGFLSGIGRAATRSSRVKNGGDELPDFLAAKNLLRFVEPAITVATNPVLFQPPGGGRPALGYRATLLPQVCEVYLAAREAGVLYASQLHIAERAEKLVRGLAAVGIIALVDEATGYQQVREKRALAAFLDRYLTDEMRAWTRTFPHEFYKEIYRLRGWGDVTNGKPAVIGRDTNEIILRACRASPCSMSYKSETRPYRGVGGVTATTSGSARSTAIRGSRNTSPP